MPYCHLFLNMKILPSGVQLPETLPEILMKKIQRLLWDQQSLWQVSHWRWPWQMTSIVFPRRGLGDRLSCCLYHLSSQFIELHVSRFLRSCLFINISIFAFFFFFFFAWMTGFQMSERSSRSLKIRLIFKLCFQRKKEKPWDYWLHKANNSYSRC